MREAWGPIYNCFENHPHIEDFIAEYKDDIVWQDKISLPPLDPIVYMARLRARQTHKAVSLDGWRTQEAQNQPLPIIKLVGKVFTNIEEGSAWPQSFLDVPAPTLAKNMDPVLLAHRILTILSVFQSTWSCMRNDQLAPWRSGWMAATACADVGRTIDEVSYPPVLSIELNRFNSSHIHGCCLDRENCFDRFAFI